MTIRAADPSDAVAIAQLHAASWQSAYRGILRDDFLAGPVLSNRRELWDARFSEPRDPGQIVLVDDCAGEIQGFVCVFLEADPDWGALLDNLHVVPALKGQGLGRRLFCEAAATVLRQRPGSRLHLWAYEQNFGARRFYERLGGEVTARVTEPAPDGSIVNELRYGWSDLAGFLLMTENRR